MSSRFHNKWHRHNHNTNPSAGEADSARDPIASHDDPFLGDFVQSPGTGVLSARDIHSNYITPLSGYFVNIPRLFTSELSALSSVVHKQDIMITETSGFVVNGTDPRYFIPDSITAGKNNVTLTGIGLSSNRWATFDGDLQTKNNLYVSGVAVIGGLSLVGCLSTDCIYPNTPGSNISVNNTTMNFTGSTEELWFETPNLVGFGDRQTKQGIMRGTVPSKSNYTPNRRDQDIFVKGAMGFSDWWTIYGEALSAGKSQMVFQTNDDAATPGQEQFMFRQYYGTGDTNYDLFSLSRTGASLSANLEMNGYSISGIGNDSLSFESGAAIKSNGSRDILLDAHSVVEHSQTGSTATGQHSHAEGNSTSASGDYSHAEGDGTTYTVIASGAGAHAEGQSILFGSTVAGGDGSHAEGNSTKAYGQAAHAEGTNTLSTGQGSHAEGASTIASGNWSHAEGGRTTASGYLSHAEGESSTASGDYSHAQGISAVASGTGSFAGGEGTLASGKWATALGYHTNAVGIYSTTLGQDTSAAGWATAEGFQTIAGIAAHSEGSNTVASGDRAHAEGGNSIASGDDSHAEGQDTVASGSDSHAEGNGTTASGDQSHAEGVDTIASGNFSHAEGVTTIAAGNISHAAGLNSHAVHANTYVWSSHLAAVSSTTTDQYTVSAENGVVLGNGVDIHGGLDMNNGSITNIASASLGFIGGETISVDDNGYITFNVAISAPDYIGVSGGGGTANALPLSGGTMTGSINMGNNSVTNANTFSLNGGGNSDEWKSTHTTVGFFSGSWDSHADLSDVAAVSGDWDTAYTFATETSASITDIQQTSGNWDSTYTTVLNTSSEWSSAYDIVQGGMYEAADGVDVDYLPTNYSVTTNDISGHLEGIDTQLLTSNTISATVGVGTSTINITPTATYEGVFYDLTIKDGISARATNVMIIWSEGGIQFTDTSTLDIGDTSNFVISASLDSGNAVLNSVVTSGTWIVKGTKRVII